MNKIFCVLLGFLFLTSGTSYAQSKRIALLIGNGNYQQIEPLRNPTHDAEEMGKALHDLGFDVILSLEAGHREMEMVVEEFVQILKQSDVGLFYYAGHGIQIEGTNYLLPVDIQVSQVADVRHKSLKADQVLDKMREANKTNANIFILDTCRNNPFKSGYRALGSKAQGLASMEGTTGTLIAFSTAKGAFAADGDGYNSVYTKHLLRRIRQPGLDILNLFNMVANDVRTETNGEQEPWISTSYISPVYLAGKKEGSINITAEPPNFIVRSPSIFKLFQTEIIIGFSLLTLCLIGGVLLHSRRRWRSRTGKSKGISELRHMPDSDPSSGGSFSRQKNKLTSTNNAIPTAQHRAILQIPALGRTIFFIARDPMGLGKVRHSRNSQVDAVLRVLPCRSQTLDPINWRKTLGISDLHFLTKCENEYIWLRDMSTNGVYLSEIQPSELDIVPSISDYEDTLAEDVMMRANIAEAPKRLRKGCWSQVADQATLLIGERTLRLQGTTLRKNNRVVGYRLSRLDNQLGTDYIQIFDQIEIGCDKENNLHVGGNVVSNINPWSLTFDGICFVLTIPKGMVGAQGSEKIVGDNRKVILDQPIVLKSGGIEMHIRLAEDEDFFE